MKAGGACAGRYYEVLRAPNKDDLDGAGRDVRRILESLPASGYVAAGPIANEEEGDGRAAMRAISWACARGVMREARTAGGISGLESVRFWTGQLSGTKTKNFSGGGGGGGTRTAYAKGLESFNGWLRGKSFPAGAARASFSDVEELLKFCEKRADGAHTARRALKEYLARLAASGCSASTAVVRCAAVKSYFAAHDIPVNVKVDRRRHGGGGRNVRDGRPMGLADLYRVVTAGGMDAMARAVMMAKFQAGLDSSTMADRFNFEAYPQLVKYFGTDDHSAWDLARCPVPVRLVRVKTGMPYTTFLDRDAVTHLQDYLARKEGAGGGRHDADKPLFVTRNGEPVSPTWISRRFSRAAASAGIQSRISPRSYRMRSHEVRDLLKSTLLASGCATYAADHVLGHAPRDSYEKQAALYPEALRAEYGKASRRINIFSGLERYLDPEEFRPGGGGGAGAAGAQLHQQQQQQQQQQQFQQDVRAMLESMAENTICVFQIFPGGRDPDGATRTFVAARRGGGRGAGGDVTAGKSGAPDLETELIGQER